MMDRGAHGSSFHHELLQHRGIFDLRLDRGKGLQPVRPFGGVGVSHGEAA
jgi:hypothetical protein